MYCQVFGSYTRCWWKLQRLVQLSVNRSNSRHNFTGTVVAPKQCVKRAGWKAFMKRGKKHLKMPLSIPHLYLQSYSSETISRAALRLLSPVLQLLHIQQREHKRFALLQSHWNTLKAKWCLFMHRPQVQTDSDVLYRVVDFSPSLQYSI